jgi:hypothetical protein
MYTRAGSNCAEFRIQWSNDSSCQNSLPCRHKILFASRPVEPFAPSLGGRSGTCPERSQRSSDITAALPSLSFAHFAFRTVLRDGEPVLSEVEGAPTQPPPSLACHLRILHSGRVCGTDRSGRFFPSLANVSAGRVAEGSWQHYTATWVGETNCASPQSASKVVSPRPNGSEQH